MKLNYMISETQKAKTALEWFEDFPEPSKTQVIKNFKKTAGAEFDAFQKAKYYSAHDALFECCSWAKLPGGKSHWKNIYDALEAGKSWEEIIKEAAND